MVSHGLGSSRNEPLRIHLDKFDAQCSMFGNIQYCLLSSLVGDNEDETATEGEKNCSTATTTRMP